MTVLPVPDLDFCDHLRLEGKDIAVTSRPVEGNDPAFTLAKSASLIVHEVRQMLAPTIFFFVCFNLAYVARHSLSDLCGLPRGCTRGRAEPGLWYARRWRAGAEYLTASVAAAMPREGARNGKKNGHGDCLSSVYMRKER